MLTDEAGWGKVYEEFSTLFGNFCLKLFQNKK